MRLESLTKMQTHELFDQMRRHLLYYTDKTVKYLECFTAHKLVGRRETVYVEVEWVYMDYFGQGDVYVTELRFITKESYENICNNQ